MKILLVEDNQTLSSTLVELFKREGYLIDACYDGVNGMDFALSGIYDIAIIDWMLPDKDGITVIESLRKQGVSIPILMLTAKEQLGDKVQALDIGADDYLTKPFQTKELLARVRALLRRKDVFLSEELSYKTLKLNKLNMVLKSDIEQISLTLKEANLIEMLILAGGNVVPKESIIEKIWGFDSNAEDNHVEVYISFLRKKLENISSDISISTARGVGYWLKESEYKHD